MAEQGYAFTALPSRVNRARRDQARFDRRVEGCFSGRIELTYRAEQPIHVGSGAKALLSGKVVRAAMRRGEQLVVPGSSFKGMVRARYEAITAACLPEPPMRGQQRRITSQTYDGWTVELTPEAKHHVVFGACKVQRDLQDAQLCPACALFGLMSLRGRVAFDDLLTSAQPEIARMPAQFGPRLHHCGTYTADSQRQVLKVNAVHGRKFHGGRGPSVPQGMQAVETIPTGSTLSGAVRVTNLTPAELGGLLSALGLKPGSYLKAGGGKPLGFGRMAPTDVGFVLKDSNRRLVEHDLAAWRAAFTASSDYHEAGERQLIQCHNRRGW